MENGEIIPTAEEFIRSKLNTSQSKYFTLEELKLVSVEFAKLHVDNALKKASEEAKIEYEYWDSGRYWGEYIDKDSILNSYPESNIK